MPPINQCSGGKLKNLVTRRTTPPPKLINAHSDLANNLCGLGSVHQVPWVSLCLGSLCITCILIKKFFLYLKMFWHLGALETCGMAVLLRASEHLKTGKTLLGSMPFTCKLTAPLICLALSHPRAQDWPPGDIFCSLEPTNIIHTCRSWIACPASPWLSFGDSTESSCLCFALAPFGILTSPCAFPMALHGVGCPFPFRGISLFVLALSQLHKLKSCRCISEHPKSRSDLQNHPRPEYWPESEGSLREGGHQAAAWALLLHPHVEDVGASARHRLYQKLRHAACTHGAHVMYLYRFIFNEL